ncbi:MAG: PKD domain-containing protein [Gemmatimonadales bacterium]
MITAGLAVAGLAVAGCGKDTVGPIDGDNVAPTANFTYACTDLACTFTDLSSDSDGSVASHRWSFGDGAEAGNKDTTHTYADAGDFSVTRSVTDNAGDDASASQMVTVSKPVNGSPTADFAVSCTSLDCTFRDLSIDADGTVVAWAWDFGDGDTDSGQNPPVHRYSATGLRAYTARLTVTDNVGLTSTKSFQFTVSPPAKLTCNGVACTLLLEQASRVTVKLTGRECTAQNNTFRITAPLIETLFRNGCYAPAVGTAFQLNGGAPFSAGTELGAEVLSGSVKLETAPALRVSGAYPTWTLSFDDGEDASAPEPDFDDLVLTVTATPTP